MAQWLGALATVLVDLSSVPSIRTMAHNHLYSGSRGSDALFWSLWSWGAHSAHIYMTATTHTPKTKQTKSAKNH